MSTKTISGATLYHDHFQNYKVYGIPKAQLVLTDIPYNVGKNAYGSNPNWYVAGDNSKGESVLAGKSFFDTDGRFHIPEFLHFCTKMLKKEPKERGEAPCMIIFCSFEQQFALIEQAKAFGLNGYLNLIFRKNFSAQVLKANMRVVGNAEYAILLYRDKLPKFRNNGRMIFNIMDWPRENRIPTIHPTQKPLAVMERLIEIFTDPGDIVIDPLAGSGVVLLAAANLGRKAIGFEIKKKFVEEAMDKILSTIQPRLFDKAILEKQGVFPLTLSQDGL